MTYIIQEIIAVVEVVICYEKDISTGIQLFPYIVRTN